MGPRIQKTVLISAYSCCPGKGSEPGYGWNYLLQYANHFEQVILVTSQIDFEALSAGVHEKGLHQVRLVKVSMNALLEKLRKWPIGGIHLHYLLWLFKARKLLKKRYSDTVDLAHHVTFGSLQFGSALADLPCPLIFGPVGGGQRTNPVFYPLMGLSRYIEPFRNMISFLFYRFNPLYKDTLNRASLIYCSNTETQQQITQTLRDRLPEKVKIMLDTALNEDFLSTPDYHPRQNPQLSLLWVGRLLPRKGLEIMIQSLALIRDLDFSLSILGEGPIRSRVEDMVSKLGLGQKVSFLGKVDYQRVRDYYQLADVLLFLSYRDSVGIQILEAFSQGLPVVTLDQFGASLLVNESNGIKIPVESDLTHMKEVIAATIRKLVFDRSLLETLGKNAQVQALPFSWENKMNTILKDLKKLGLI